MSLADFDAWCEERGVAADDLPYAFAEWLANHSGSAVIVAPAGEPPIGLALPEDHPG